MRFRILILLVSVFVGMNFLASEVRANSYSDEFVKHLVSCTPYKKESPFDFMGMKITPTVVVKKGSNGKCIYENYAKENPQDKYVCYFTKAQLKEIELASKKDKNSVETHDLGGMSYSSDPISIILTKFLNDGTTCKTPSK